jgi:hypothetical protein
LVGATRGEQLSMWDYIEKVRYNFPTGIEKFKFSLYHMQKKIIIIINTLVKDPGDKVYKRSKSYTNDPTFPFDGGPCCPTLDFVIVF